MSGEAVDVATFNELPGDDAVTVLRVACESAFWLRVLVAGRPYASAQEILAASDGVIQALGWSEVARVLPMHALAVDPPAGIDLDGLRQYEERFDFPFVMETTGRTAEEIDREMAARIAGDADAEQTVARRELAAIVRRCLVVNVR